MHARLNRAEAAYLLPATLSPAEERLRSLRIAAAEAHQAMLRRTATRLLARVGDALLGWVRRAQVRAELASMTDHELADIGIARGDIDRVVNGSASAAKPEPRRTPRPAGFPAPRPA